MDQEARSTKVGPRFKGINENKHISAKTALNSDASLHSHPKYLTSKKFKPHVQEVTS